MGGAPGEGWLPIHAADLLGELKAVDAIPHLVRWLVKAEEMTYLKERLPRTLVAIGQPAYEPLMAACGQEEEEGTGVICSKPSAKSATEMRSCIRSSSRSYRKPLPWGPYTCPCTRTSGRFLLCRKPWTSGNSVKATAFSMTTQ